MDVYHTLQGPDVLERIGILHTSPSPPHARTHTHTHTLTEVTTDHKVMIYSGNLDIIVGAPLTEAFMSKLSFNGSAAFHSAPRKPYALGGDEDGEVVGYVKHAGNLTQVVVRGAGHILPHDQPGRGLDLISRFVDSVAGWCRCDAACLSMGHAVTHSSHAPRRQEDKEGCCPPGTCQA